MSILKPLYAKPKDGVVVMCEGVWGKTRPVVVVAPTAGRLGKSPLCVVPLSTAARHWRMRPWQVRLHHESLPGGLGRTATWAMCDGIQSVTMERLGFVLVGGMATACHQVVEEDLRAIRNGLSIVLGLGPSGSGGKIQLHGHEAAPAAAGVLRLAQG